MYHSITFESMNTWDDWHLIPSSRPLFNPPSVKLNLIEIPGGDGVLDLTNVLAGRPLYGNRTGSIEFLVENGFKDWATLYSEIMTFLHGQRMRAILEDDPGYYYLGRFSVNSWKSSRQRSTITIDYNVDPYKHSANITNADWEWDLFNFTTDLVRYYLDIPVDGDFRLVVIIDDEILNNCPPITVSTSGMSVDFDGRNYKLTKGVNLIPYITLSKGENYFTFHGKGVISIGNVGGDSL